MNYKTFFAAILTVFAMFNLWAGYVRFQHHDTHGVAWHILSIVFLTLMVQVALVLKKGDE